ncbi:MAG: sigma 54-interacting transcriptional regulator [Syntrophales bacterium]
MKENSSSQIGQGVWSDLPVEDRKILCRFAAFRDFFSVDWFANLDNVLPSQLLSLVAFLEKHEWISPIPVKKGFYSWTPQFPRESILAHIPASEKSMYYRDAANVLIKHFPDVDDYAVKIANQCILAGVQECDLNVILRAALFEENNHRTASAISLYDTLLEFSERLIRNSCHEKVPMDLCRIFITAVERRASLSLLYPDLKKIKPLLDLALDLAKETHDIKSQGSLELLIGQNYWMRFQYDQASLHFELGWEAVKDIKDAGLRKRGLQMRGLSHWVRGELSKAVQCYEESLGELDHIGTDTFSLLTGLLLSQCYTQVGMPQRGLGLSEHIYAHAKKNDNLPIIAFSLANTGLILLEMRQANCRTYFEMALELARRESIPMAEVVAGIGLANIECMEGNFEKAAEHFRVLYKIRKSSWYHTLNSSHIFEPGFILHRADISPVELNPVINFLSEIRKDQVNPLMYAIIRRLRLQYIEREKKPREIIAELVEIERALEKIGALLELSKVRMDIARNCLIINKWQHAENYARKAWKFLRLNAREAFYPDLKHLIKSEDLSTEDRLFDLIVEMGEALTHKSNVESFLTDIVSSLSRLTGAERAGLFIKDEGGGNLRIAASRNLTQEYLESASFDNTMRILLAAAGSTDNKVYQHEKYNEKTGEIRHVIITPLVIGKKAIGVLYQDSRFFSFDISPDKIRLLSALASQIAVAIDRAQAYAEISHLKQKLIDESRYYDPEDETPRPINGIVGGSNTILQLQQIISKVAPTRSTILILGETGVGKELVARAIHLESERKDGPFIRVNCAALPDTLIDSELFGYEKGAFTGAVKTKPGRFELANEGTIFLDEVSELPLSTQSRLLRILQEKEFQRVGGTKTLYSDFRLIAATNKDLEKEVQSGKFRADLFFRLNVFPIRVAPLRERKEDIPLLAAHFLKIFSAQYNRHFARIPQSEMSKLLSYSWPGNVRELANVMERAVIMGGPRLTLPELSAIQMHPETGAEIHSLKETEKRQIIRAIQAAGGKIGGEDGAASLLGLKRTTLIHKMKKLGIILTRNPA